MDRHSPFESFYYFYQFLGAYFHQDFAMSGSAEDVVRLYVSGAEIEESYATVADIRRFLHYRSHDLDKAFIELFNPSIEPRGWGMTVAEWLAWIDKLLIAGIQARQTDIPSNE